MSTVTTTQAEHLAKQLNAVAMNGAATSLMRLAKERDELLAHCMALSNDVEKGVEVMQRVLDSGVLTGEYDTLVHDHLVNYQFAKVPEYSLSVVRRKVLTDLAKELKEVGSHIGVNYQFIQQRADKHYPDKEQPEYE